MDFQAQEENLMFAAKDAIRRAQQRGNSEKVLVVSLDTEGGTIAPCVAITEGYQIRLTKIGLMMRLDNDQAMWLDYDCNRLHQCDASPGFMAETLCFDMDSKWAYAVAWREKKSLLPAEMYLRAEADNLYFAAYLTRKYKPEVHFAYTDDPSLRIILDRFVTENQDRMQKEVTGNE